MDGTKISHGGPGNLRAADAAGIAAAARLLAAGGAVAVPTETVYGLAARADDDAAVAGIYRAKGRPDFNPLIVHIPDAVAARALAAFDDRAEALAAAFWPGALTMVCPVRGLPWRSAPACPRWRSAAPRIR